MGRDLTWSLACSRKPPPHQPSCQGAPVAASSSHPGCSRASAAGEEPEALTLGRGWGVGLFLSTTYEADPGLSPHQSDQSSHMSLCIHWGHPPHSIPRPHNQAEGHPHEMGLGGRAPPGQSGSLSSSLSPPAPVSGQPPPRPPAPGPGPAPWSLASCGCRSCLRCRALGSLWSLPRCTTCPLALFRNRCRRIPGTSSKRWPAREEGVSAVCVLGCGGETGLGRRGLFGMGLLLGGLLLGEGKDRGQLLLMCRILNPLFFCQHLRDQAEYKRQLRRGS